MPPARRVGFLCIQWGTMEVPEGVTDGTTRTVNLTGALTGPRITIGRSETNNVVPDGDARASREHAVLTNADENKQATPSALDDLAKDADALTRLFVAVNPRTFRTTLERMRQDEEPGVREVVAQRLNWSMTRHS
jgi:hypothetical protein